MIGIIVVSHGNLSKEIIETSKLIIGEQKKCDYLTLNHGDDPEVFGSNLEKKVKRINDGDGVLVFADLFGGTPCNQAVFLKKRLSRNDLKVIAGVNLPIFLELVNSRESIKDINVLMENFETIKGNLIVDVETVLDFKE